MNDWKPGLRSMPPVVLLMGLAVIASPAHAASPAGTWHASLDGREVELQLRNDGSGAFDGHELQWQTLGALLLVELGGDVVSYAFSVQGDRLTVSGGDFASAVQFQRGNAAKAAKSAKPTASGGAGAAAAKAGGGMRQELVGKWCYAAAFSANAGGGSQSSRCFELRPDGSYIYAYEGSVSAYGGSGGSMYGGSSSQSGDQGRWTATATTLTAQSANGSSQTYRLELRNHPKNRDPMICLDGDCFATFWSKAPW